MSNSRIEVTEPEVSEEELETALKLGLSALNACKDVCREKKLDLSVAVTALGVALVKCSKDHGMELSTLLGIIKDLATPSEKGN